MYKIFKPLVLNRDFKFIYNVLFSFKNCFLVFLFQPKLPRFHFLSKCLFKCKEDGLIKWRNCQSFKCKIKFQTNIFLLYLFLNRLFNFAYAQFLTLVSIYIDQFSSFSQLFKNYKFFATYCETFAQLTRINANISRIKTKRLRINARLQRFNAKHSFYYAILLMCSLCTVQVTNVHFLNLHVLPNKEKSFLI